MLPNTCLSPLRSASSCHPATSCFCVFIQFLLGISSRYRGIFEIYSGPGVLRLYPFSVFIYFLYRSVCSLFLITMVKYYIKYFHKKKKWSLVTNLVLVLHVFTGHVLQHVTHSISKNVIHSWDTQVWPLLTFNTETSTGILKRDSHKTGRLASLLPESRGQLGGGARVHKRIDNVIITRFFMWRRVVIGVRLARTNFTHSNGVRQFNTCRNKCRIMLMFAHKYNTRILNQQIHLMHF